MKAPTQSHPPYEEGKLDESTAVRFGRHVVIQILGAGGMATVFLALRRGEGGGPDRLVALKQSHTGLSRSAQWKDALREAHCGTSIRHPNVVRVLEVGDGAQGPFIVMEYIEGGSVLALLTEAEGARGSALRLPVPIAVRIIVDALRGLDAAHNARDASGALLGLIHRDVSPHNVLVGTDGIARLADFGIARLVQLTNPVSGMVRGKAGYVAPEQTLGKVPDRRSDIFSMGVVFWEALTGRRLFKGKDAEDTLKRVQTVEAPAVKALAPEVPDSIAMLLASSLSKDPRKRPRSALEFAETLESFAAEDGVIASHAQVSNDVIERLRGPLQRRQTLLAEWCFATGNSGSLATSRVSLAPPKVPAIAPAPASAVTPSSRNESALVSQQSHPDISRAVSGTNWLALSFDGMQGVEDTIVDPPREEEPSPASNEAAIIAPHPRHEGLAAPVSAEGRAEKARTETEHHEHIDHEHEEELERPMSRLRVATLCLLAALAAWACGYICAEPRRVVEGVVNVLSHLRSAEQKN